MKHDCPYREVRRQAAEAFGVPEIRIIGCRRTKNVVLARHAAAYALHQKFNMNRVQIAELLGGMDRSTITYAIQQFPKRMRKDPSVRHRYRTLRIRARPTRKRYRRRIDL